MLEIIERTINQHRYKISFDDGSREKVDIAEVEPTLEEETVDYFINNDAEMDFNGTDFWLRLPIISGFMAVFCECIDNNQHS